MGFIVNNNVIVVYENRIEDFIKVCRKEVIKLSKKYSEVVIDISVLRKIPLTLLLCLEDIFSETQLKKITMLIDEEQANTLQFFEMFLGNDRFEFKIIKREQ